MVGLGREAALRRQLVVVAEAPRQARVVHAAPAGGPIRKPRKAGGAVLNDFITHQAMWWEALGGHAEEPLRWLAGGGVGYWACGGDASEFGWGVCKRGGVVVLGALGFGG